MGEGAAGRAQGEDAGLSCRFVAQNDEVVLELAMQMGRPVRYGGELRSFEERVRGLVELSDEALAPTMPAERPGFRRMIKRVPVGSCW